MTMGNCRSWAGRWAGWAMDDLGEPETWTDIRRLVLLTLLLCLLGGACITLLRAVPPERQRLACALFMLALIGIAPLSGLLPWLVSRLGWRGELVTLGAIIVLCGSMYLYVLHVRATADPAVQRSCADSFAPNCIPVPPGPSLFPDRHWRRYGHRSH